VALYLFSLASMTGVDLQAEVEAKIEKNVYRDAALTCVCHNVASAAVAASGLAIPYRVQLVGPVDHELAGSHVGLRRGLGKGQAADDDGSGEQVDVLRTRVRRKPCPVCGRFALGDGIAGLLGRLSDARGSWPSLTGRLWIHIAVGEAAGFAETYRMFRCLATVGTGT
jgi:hypothetical protein